MDNYIDIERIKNKFASRINVISRLDDVVYDSSEYVKDKNKMYSDVVEAMVYDRYRILRNKDKKDKCVYNVGYRSKNGFNIIMFHIIGFDNVIAFIEEFESMFDKNNADDVAALYNPYIWWKEWMESPRFQEMLYKYNHE